MSGTAMILPTAIFSGAVFPAILYAAEVRGKKKPALIVKALSSLSFVFLGFLCGRASPLTAFAGAFLAGEAFGAVGDVIINLQPWFPHSGGPFFIGGACFFIGHLFYLLAVSRVEPSALLLGILLTLLVFTLLLFLLKKLTAMEKPVRVLITLYMLTVSAFFSFSLSAFIAGPGFGRGLLALGSLLFLLSDFDLMLNNYGYKKSRFIFNCMYIYYPAQVVIALSLYWFE